MEAATTRMPPDAALRRNVSFAEARPRGDLAGIARPRVPVRINEDLPGLIDRIIGGLAGGFSRFARFEVWLAARRPASISASPRYAGFERPACLRRAARRRDG